MLSGKEMFFRRCKDEKRGRGDLPESLNQPGQSPRATWESFGFPASPAASQVFQTQKRRKKQPLIDVISC
jgi:hypothetical protein